MPTLELALNGRAVTDTVDASTLLVDWLREARRLTGTHVGCDTAQCGACTVLVDGAAVRSCSILAAQAAGRSITTIEGLAPPEGLHSVQEAFIACHGLQCGFCTPGMILSTVSLLREHPRPTDEQIRQGLEGNLCRCTGYANIVESVRHAAESIAAEGTR